MSKMNLMSIHSRNIELLTETEDNTGFGINILVFIITIKFTIILNITGRDFIRKTIIILFLY